VRETGRLEGVSEFFRFVGDCCKSVEDGGGGVSEVSPIYIYIYLFMQGSSRFSLQELLPKHLTHVKKKNECSNCEWPTTWCLQEVKVQHLPKK
jgi:hypothetical protein